MRSSHLSSRAFRQENLPSHSYRPYIDLPLAADPMEELHPSANFEVGDETIEFRQEAPPPTVLSLATDKSALR